VPVEPEILKTRTLADGTTFVESARGAVTLSRLAPGVVLFQCRGILSGKFYWPMVAVAKREVDAHGKLAMFVDGWDLKSVDTDFREPWTAWFKEHRDRFGMRLLVRTKLMEMAASLANLLTGIAVIKTYSNLGAWNAACTADFPAFRNGRREPA
jgi:hypothetical protein